MMDRTTATIVDLILHTSLDGRQDLLEQGKIAFLDYIASALKATGRSKVREAAAWCATFPGDSLLLGSVKTAHPIYAAFYNGLTSHFLDLDDAQANIAGHFSTVLFSTLLAVSDAQVSVLDFLTAYVAGAELEGIIGRIVAPEHKLQGWHSTGTIGTLGAAAAIARLKKLDAEETAQLLSLSGTQSAGLGLQAGSDAKPMHAGMAARNAVFAYELLGNTSLTARDTIFNNDNGWLPTFASRRADADEIRGQWLAPGQILQPGLWMKVHPYCSAAICGEAACKALYAAGVNMDNLEKITFHFPPGADRALHYREPQTGLEGKFSMEYVAWQVLDRGFVKDENLDLPLVPQAFKDALPLMERVNDLPKVDKAVRRIVVMARTKDGRTWSAEEDKPVGSPQRPFTESELKEKLVAARESEWAEELLRKTQAWPRGTMENIYALLKV